MKPVDQTKFGFPEGNCFEACVASILEIPIEAVPRYPDESSWFEFYQDWIKQFGLTLIDIDGSSGVKPQGYSIMSGMSPRGKFMHATVALDGEMVHDPHSDRTGIVQGGPLEYCLFVVLDAAKYAAAMRDIQQAEYARILLKTTAMGLAEGLILAIGEKPTDDDVLSVFSEACGNAQAALLASGAQIPGMPTTFSDAMKFCWDNGLATEEQMRKWAPEHLQEESNDAVVSE